MIRVYIRNGELYSKPLEYILTLLAKNRYCPITFFNERNEAQLIFDHNDPFSLPINIELFDSLFVKKIFHHEAHFKDKPLIFFPDSNSPDWLGTAFYMINSFQEYNYNHDHELTDKYGRFRFDRSYQHKFDCNEKNLVQQYLDNFCAEHLPFIEQPAVKRKTKIFISHDIDTIHGSMIEDGLWALKRGRLDIILRLMMNEVLLKPDWKNIDKIVTINSTYDLVSTFFWLAVNKTAKNGIKNADYKVEKVKNIIDMSVNNGIHKSCYTTSFSEELKRLPFTTDINRYHYLRINLPHSYKELEEAKILFDSSLGFADRFGFRNSYGLPFRPFDIEKQTSFHFVETPLNIMDGTLKRYMGIPIHQTASRMIDFIEHNLTDTIISIVWHNTYFTNYKYSGYLQEYKKLLLYLHETKIEFITPKEIMDEYGKD
jgi:hypothetical protein